jgi:response regulator RpfG family c-di-GMP phosphodiesterase
MSDVLIVDDEPMFRRLVRRFLDVDGLQAVEAESAEQALLLASQDPPQVALCDINLPRGQTGFWLIERLHELHPETAVIVTSGMHGFDAAITGLQSGVVDYVVKPFSRDRLHQALTRAFADHRSRVATRTVMRELDGREGAGDVAATSVPSLLAVLRAEDGDTARHATRVAALSVQIAGTLGIRQPALSDIERAALLRDVRRLDVHGIARNVPFLAAAEALVVAIEEKFDGTGFPMGLRGETIPLGSRIIAVAEAIDGLLTALGGGRLTPATAAEKLAETRGREFDPMVLHAVSATDRQEQRIATH